jgi:hypothetical protein
MLPALARQGKREKRRITYLAPPPLFLPVAADFPRSVDRVRLNCSVKSITGSITAESFITIFPVEKSAKQLFGWLL